MQMNANECSKQNAQKCKTRKQEQGSPKYV
jgi:hypothetical protein